MGYKVELLVDGDGIGHTMVRLTDNNSKSYTFGFQPIKLEGSSAYVNIVDRFGGINYKCRKVA